MLVTLRHEKCNINLRIIIFYTRVLFRIKNTWQFKYPVVCNAFHIRFRYHIYVYRYMYTYNKIKLWYNYICYMHMYDMYTYMNEISLYTYRYVCMCHVYTNIINYLTDTSRRETPIYSRKIKQHTTQYKTPVYTAIN